LAYAVFYAIVAAILWRAFQRAMIQEPEGIFTGLLNNFGDLPFHISVITGFAFGNNFPPQDPTFAGVHFTYPFLTDFVSAIFVACGANLRDSMFIENFIVGVAFVGLVHRWALVMLRDRLAAVLTPILVLLNGGLGWVLLWDSSLKPGGLLNHLPPSFTVIPETTWRWGNAISSLLVPQRGILLGLPLAVIVFTQWWLATGEKTDTAIERHEDRGKGTPKKLWGAKKLKGRDETGAPRCSAVFFHASATARMVAAGIVAGLLPLVHAHSFVVVMTVGAGIALVQRRWRLWITFAAVASLIAIPQVLWSTSGSAVKATSFFAWEF